jgi:RNA polymerase sigma-70 factor (ECF subfamily)
MSSDLEAAIDDAFRAGQAAHAELALDRDVFRAHVERILEGEATAEAARQLRAEDLFLTIACATGSPRAIAELERRYFREVETAYARIKPGVSLEEAKQAVRHRLFVVADDGAPRVAAYAGRGDLRSWVRVTVVRTLLNLATRGPKREVPLDDERMEALASPAADPELAHLRRTYAKEFEAAFAAAIAGLEGRERSLLRYAFVDGLTVDAIGALYDVHRATAARWVAAARAALEERVKAGLAERLRVSRDELASILRVVSSHIEVTLGGYLKAPSG